VQPQDYVEERELEESDSSSQPDYEEQDRPDNIVTGREGLNKV